MMAWRMRAVFAGLAAALAALGLARASEPGGGTDGPAPRRAGRPAPEARLRRRLREPAHALRGRPALALDLRRRAREHGGDADPAEQRRARGLCRPCLAGAPARARPDPFRTGPEGLKIVADRPRPALAHALEGHPYASGLITTQPSFSQTFGYFEMRRGCRAARGSGPPSGCCRRPRLAAGDRRDGEHRRSRRRLPDHPLQARPTPGVEIAARRPGRLPRLRRRWDPQWVAWYVDGRETARRPTPPDADKPMYMLVNLAVGGHWPGAPMLDPLPGGDDGALGARLPVRP